MNVLDVTILTAALVNLVLSGTVYFHSRREQVATIFGSFALSVSVWSLATFLMTSRTVSFDLFRAGAVLHYISGNLVFWSLFWFSVYFPSRKDHSLFLPRVLSVANALILIAIVSTSFLFVAFNDAAALSDKIAFNSTGYVILSGITVWMFTLSQVFLSRKYFAAAGDEKTQIGGIIAATSIAGSLGLFTNLILPGFGNFSLFYLGPIITTPLFVGLMIYAIFKYKLFNLRVIAAEICTALLLVALVAELFLSTTSAEIGTRSVILFIAAIIGGFLIRSVYREIKAREEIEQLNATMEEFLAITSHQIRSPLTHIKDGLSVLREGDYGTFDFRAVPILDYMYGSANRLIHLVNDLLDKSRMESGRMQYTFGEFDLNALVDSLVAEFKAPAQEKGVSIGWRNEGKPVLVWGDEEKIRQVVFNLIDNALKYTQKGMIELSVAGLDDRAELVIKDTGAGMTQETIDRLFKKFSRADQGPKARTHGTGLGLYVAKRIIDDHHGELWAESDGEGKGSAFHMRLASRNEGAINNLTRDQDLRKAA